MYSYILIDDEELIRKGTRKKLAAMDEEITCIAEAENGLEGTRLIAELHPDFVILDMQMPVMDGMELLPYLAAHYESMPLIVISGYKNFDYIKQAISARAVEYLLKPFSAEMIQACVRKVIDQLQARTEMQEQLQLTEEQTEAARYDYDINLLHNLIYGYRTTDTVLTSNRLNYINDTHNLVLLTFGYAEIVDDSTFPMWLEENSFGDMALYISGQDVQQPQGFLILFLPQQGRALQTNLIRQVADAFHTYLLSLRIDAVVGFSEIHHSLSELSVAYQEAAQALDQQQIVDDGTRSYQYDPAATPAAAIEWERTSEFLFRVEAGMSDAVAALCDELFANYRTIPGCRLLDVKNHCRRLSSGCYQILNTYLNSTNSVENSGTMNRVSGHTFRVQDLEDYYRQLFLNITAMLQPYSVYNNDDTIENIKVYIQRNYQQDLTQDFLASLFYINRSYLSTQFRKRTGDKFVDYLNDVRLAHAEELLQNPEQRMYQIARAVGYDNEKYFFRIFKKRTGMTPEQYRSQVLRS